jgi:replicative DNA helicase
MSEIDSSIGRLPPQAPEIESAVLGAMMQSSDAIYRVTELLDDSCFYKEAHRKIYSAMMSIFERNEPIDIITVSEELKKRDLLDKVGGTYYLSECINQVTTAANVEFHARIILQKSLLRKLIEATTKIASEGYEESEDAHNLLDRAEQMIFEISEKRLRKGFKDIKPILHDALEKIDSYHKRKGFVTGVPSGFVRLDELTSGFQNSDLIIIAGRPTCGKTALSLNIARNAAVDYNVPVGIFSLEMAELQIAMRLLCGEAKVSSHHVRTGRLPNEDWQRLAIVVGSLSEAPIYIDDSGVLGILEIRSKARRLKAEKNIGLLIIDYLQLIKGPSNVESRQQEISLISRSLKALAKELDIPIIALSQLSRAVEKRGVDSRPILSDLRESGAIEQDADVVIFIHRPEEYKDGKWIKGYEAEIRIAKQRNGPTDDFELVFLREITKFENKEPYRTEMPVHEVEPF